MLRLDGLASQFVRFALVGVAGFAVDVSVLYLVTSAFGTGPYLGRVISYLAAATSTWYLNRCVTFADRRSTAAGWEWGRFVLLNAIGGLLNYATYAAWIRHAGASGVSPAIGVALGSLAGLAANFTLSRQFVFRRHVRSRIRSPVQAPWRLSIAAVLLAAGLMWPALYNGQPIFFGDTSAYIRGADAGVQALFHRRSAWSLAGADALAPDGEHAPGRPAPTRLSAAQASAARSSAARPDRHGSSIRDKSVLFGRSPYYGTLLYIGELAGGFWLTVLLQAAAVLLSLALIVRAAGLPLWPTWAIAGVCIVALTSAPYFVSFLMPDVFAGIAILLSAVLLSPHVRLRRGEVIAATVLLSLCAIFHESHPLIIGALFLVALLIGALRRSWTNWRGISAVGASLGVAVLGQVAFAQAVEHVVGAPPLRPPFLMGRLIEDGPGYRYLRETCPSNGFAVCAYLDHLPMPANLFVWDTGPRGVFGAAPPQVRRRLSDEQVRFVLAVVSRHPLEQISASLANAGSLLTMVGLGEFEYGAGQKAEFAAKIPAEHLQRLRQTPAYRGTLPADLAAGIGRATYAIGALVLLVALMRRRYRSQLPRPLVEISAWVLLGVLANAIVCGALSGPHDRYEARVAWTLPLAALLVAAAGMILARRPSHAAPQIMSEPVAEDGT